MSNLFIAPAAGPEAQKHLDATVRQRVPLAALDGLSETALKLAAEAPDGVAAWGTRPGRNNVNVGTWLSMDPGDWVLFYFERQFPLCGRVLVREQSSIAADRLWGSDDSGTWEYMYLLDELREIDVPRPLALQALDYEEGFFPRGFIRVKRDLEARYGSIEQLLERLAGMGHEFRRVVDAARTPNEAETAAVVDSVGSEMSEQAYMETVAGYTSSEPPEVQEQLTKRIKRDRKLGLSLKALYQGRCQVCDFTFLKKDGTPYSEAAHIRPISLLEANLDVKDNLLVLCPNHHKMLDHGALKIEIDPASHTLVSVTDLESKPLRDKHILID